MKRLFSITSWQAGSVILLLLTSVSARATRVSGNSSYGADPFTAVTPSGETPITGITEGEFQASSVSSVFVYYFQIGDLNNFELSITGPTTDLQDYGVLECDSGNVNTGVFPCTENPDTYNVITELNGVIDADPTGTPPPTSFNTMFDVTGSGDGLVLFVAETNGTPTSPAAPGVSEQPLSTPEPRWLGLAVAGLMLVAQKLRRFSLATFGS